MARPMKVLAGAAVAGLLLAAPPVTNAYTAVVEDPDEPGLTDRNDIEWAEVEQPPSVNGRLVRHTIKTRSPYGPARTPWLYLRASSERPGKYRNYRIRGTMMLGPDGERAAVWRNETPAGDPDTVSYTFDLAQIGLPVSYEWRAETPDPLETDLVPDAGWVVHRIAPRSLPAAFR